MNSSIIADLFADFQAFDAIESISRRDTFFELIRRFENVRAVPASALFMQWDCYSSSPSSSPTLTVWRPLLQT